MADSSKIEWTDATWNPVTGCTKVSPGCDHCYDLFHEQVPDRFIAQVFEVMGAAKQHTFQVLTKRHGRMRSLLNRWSEHATKGCYCPADQGGCSAPVDVEHGEWPLPNVWLGVSVENQQWADIRIPALMQTPAAVRFLSCEPLVDEVSLPKAAPVEPYWHSGIDWVIVGGESGPGARPMREEWARSLVEQCRDGDVPVFVKQMGSVWAKGEAWDGPSASALGDRKGGDWQFWPADLRVREFPQEVADHG